MTIETIDKRIAELKELKESIDGTECEVYSRIVGYYRAVKNWNKGQAAQRKQRKNYITGVKEKDMVAR